MPELKRLQNGVTKAAKNGTAKKRRNTAKKQTRKAAPKAKRRNGTSLAAAKAALKKNGLKAVSSRSRKNGTTRSKRNGLFGDTKDTSTAVASLVGGMIVTKVVGRFAGNAALPLMRRAGLERVAQPVAELATAAAVGYGAKQIFSDKDVGKFAMYGGISVAVLTGIERVMPESSPFNPFAPNDAIMVNGKAAISPDAARQIADRAQDVANDAAKMAGALGGGYYDEDDVLNAGVFVEE